MTHKKTFDAIAKLKDVEVELHRLKNALEMANRALDAKDEPVGWAEHGVINWLADKQFNHTSFLYATPSKRTWVGLTYEDMVKLQKDLYDAKGESVLPTTFAMAVEAKLKEKNGG
jgi:hypothetical protein